MILALFLACSGPRSAAELPVADAPPPAAEGAPADGALLDGTAGGVAPVDGAPAAEATPIGGPPQTPGEAYLGCKDRVEGPQVAGECKTDADCTKTGCSQEVCVASAHAAEIMTTCEILPCFAALDACGCHEGMCSWTLVPTMPPMGRIQLPPKAQ